jgi:hypothetical protein
MNQWRRPSPAYGRMAHESARTHEMMIGGHGHTCRSDRNKRCKVGETYNPGGRGDGE